jgi:hypothetical protein
MPLKEPKSAQDPKATARSNRPGKKSNRREGRPAFVPTAENRRLVESMSGLRVPQVHIARMLTAEGIHVETLRKYFQDELDLGHMKADANLARVAYSMAVDDKNPTLMIWCTKQFLGWKEPKRELEHSGNFGNKTHEEALNELDADKSANESADEE